MGALPRVENDNADRVPDVPNRDVCADAEEWNPEVFNLSIAENLLDDALKRMCERCLRIT